MKHTALFGAMMLVLALAASAADADPRRGRGEGWGGGNRPSHHQNWNRGGGWGGSPRYYRPSNAGEAFWGGVVGGALSNIFRPEPEVVVIPPPVVVQQPRSIEWCIDTFRSYDPETGYYTAYDGRRLPCP
jgi:hypothetical protein